MRLLRLHAYSEVMAKGPNVRTNPEHANAKPFAFPAPFPAAILTKILTEVNDKVPEVLRIRHTIIKTVHNDLVWKLLD